MPNPKRKMSKTRTRKRRTNYKAKVAAIVVDGSNETPHLNHRAYWLEGKLYYNGRVIKEKKEKVAE